MPAPKEGNPLWGLRMAHFGPCHLIYHRFLFAKRRFSDPLTQEEAADEFLAYTHLWMALLYVTVEGFLQLKIDNPKIGSLLSEQRLDDLRLFRNSVFHPQKSFDKRERMHAIEKLNWAQDLHIAFVDFFASQDEVPDA